MAGDNSALLKVFERLPLAVVVASPLTGRILWSNDRDLQVVGATSPDQLIGRNILEFLEPGQHGVALRDLAAVALGQSPPPVVYCLRRLDGGVSHVQISSVPIVHEGRPAMLSLVADVTEREHLIREFVEAEGRFHQLVEAMTDGVVVVVDDEIMYGNCAAAEMVGLEDPSELAGSKMYDFIEPSMRPAVREARRQVMLTGNPQHEAPVTLVTPDGTLVEATAQTSIVHWQGALASQTVLRRNPAGDQEGTEESHG